MLDLESPTILRMISTCSAMLRELQKIWNEIGESETQKDHMLMELEKECVEVYRRKVDEAANAKARLQKTVAVKEAEPATLMAALGERDLHSQIPSDKRLTSLKEQLSSVTPLVEDLRSIKDEQIKQSADVKAQIQKISGEISECCSLHNDVTNSTSLDEEDLSLRRLTEYQTLLCFLEKDKSDRLNQVVGDVDPSLPGSDPEQPTNISNRTLRGLEQAIVKSKEERKAQFQKLKDIVTSLSELWNLMDTSEDERSCFSRIVSILGRLENEITEPGLLSMDVVDQVSTEVERLKKLRASKMKELVTKKRSELEEICRLTHIEPDTSTAAEKSNALIDSGLVGASELLANIEAQIVKAKEETLSRKEIMDSIDRWLSVCEEDNWLEEYNR
ncbi:hypothetical protein Nepgr_016980 [Nepenthes gracilis]|uniref:Uncharacterized protein n=1 Tax=Nepenthes gracilis TaxID=150966 RepID=A0AAD3SQQ3_NEPGR|nr:hypothetical protein Nepgr_016980 [Nepenthes gracilis]